MDNKWKELGYIDELLAEFDRWVPLLKRMAYKQEYWD